MTWKPLAENGKPSPLPNDRIEYDPVAVKAEWRWAIERAKQLRNETDRRMEDARAKPR